MEPITEMGVAHAFEQRHLCNHKKPGVTGKSQCASDK